MGAVAIREVSVRDIGTCVMTVQADSATRRATRPVLMLGTCDPIFHDGCWIA
jgi:hypothetical protein